MITTNGVHVMFDSACEERTDDCRLYVRTRMGMHMQPGGAASCLRRRRRRSDGGPCPAIPSQRWANLQVWSEQRHGFTRLLFSECLLASPPPPLHAPSIRAPPNAAIPAVGMILFPS
jgi:hypothetical protein